MPFQDSTPGDGYVKDGKPYIFTDTKGSVAPAMRDPQTNKWVPDQRAMATGGMAQIGAKVASPEDDAALKAMVAEVGPKEHLANAAREFMKAKGGVKTGPQWGALPVYGGDAQSMIRRNLARTDPDTEARLEQMEAINSSSWPTLRPEGSGPIRVIEAKGWKNAFPSISNVDQANTGISDRLWHDYANASNESDFVQNYVHSGKGTKSAGSAAFQNMARTPNAQGRQQELGAAPGDFSGKLPGWSQGLTPKQLAAAKLYANSSKPPGDKGNPYVPASLDEYNKLGGGAWLVDDDGKLIQKPGAAPAVRR